MAWGLSLASGVGVVLGLVGLVGCPWWGICCLLLVCGSVSCLRGPASPWCGRVFLVLNSFGVGLFGLLSQD